MNRDPTSASRLHDEAHVDRTALQVLTFEEAERQDRAYWHSRTPIERLRHQEYLRELNYGPEVINQRLQRVLAVSERTRG